MHPIIGITAGFSNYENKHYLTEYYVKAVEAAGGIPLILPSIGIGLVETIYDQVDGIIFSGGGDVDPSYFGENPQRGIEEIVPERDKFELYLAKKCLNGTKPVLGICRGIQVLNIAAGGDIYQDIKEVTKQEHIQKAPKWYPYHDIEIEKDSVLLKIIGKSKIKVNSFHHQTVREIGVGLRKVAQADDGLIEAIESIDPRKVIIGVQWHPECSWERDKYSRLLFEYIIREARDRKG